MHANPPHTSPSYYCPRLVFYNSIAHTLEGPIAYKPNITRSSPMLPLSRTPQKRIDPIESNLETLLKQPHAITSTDTE